MEGYKYLKIYSIIDIVIIIFFGLLYILTLKTFLLLFISSFSLIFLTYIFLYYGAKRGWVHFIKEDTWTKHNKMIYMLYIIALIFSLFVIFQITDQKLIRISSIIVEIILLSFLLYNYNKKLINIKDLSNK